MKKVAGTFLAGLIAIATNADAGPSSFVCTPIGVQADANLAAIRCSNPSHTLPVFFYGTERNSALAEDVRQLGIAALTSNKKLFISFEMFSSSNPPGCLSLDCRRLYTIRLE